MMFGLRSGRATRRRQALVAAGCSTFEVQEIPSMIVCLCCGRPSYNPNDVAHLYCGFCHEYHVVEIPYDAHAGGSDQDEDGGAVQSSA